MIYFIINFYIRVFLLLKLGISITFSIDLFFLRRSIESKNDHDHRALLNLSFKLFLQSQMFKTTQQRKRINSKKCPNCKKKRKVIIIVLVFVIAVLTIVIVAVVVTNKTDNTEVRNYNTTSIVYNTTENGTSTLG